MFFKICVLKNLTIFTEKHLCWGLDKRPQVKGQDESINILRTKRAFNTKQEAFYINFKGRPVVRNRPRPASGSLRMHLL